MTWQTDSERRLAIPAVFAVLAAANASANPAAECSLGRDGEIVLRGLVVARCGRDGCYDRREVGRFVAAWRNDFVLRSEGWRVR